LIIIHVNSGTVKREETLAVVDTVVGGHEQIGAYEETGAGPVSVRRVPHRYDNPTDFGSEAIVLTICGEVPHLFKVWGPDDIFGCPLKVGGALEILGSVSRWERKGVSFENSALVISEPVCQTKGHQTKNAYKKQNVRFST